MLKIGRGVSRAEVARALRRRGALTVTYSHVLTTDEIREAVAGVRAAGSPTHAGPLLAWLGSHPATSDDVLRDLLAGAPPREVLIALALNPRLPVELRPALLASPDEDVREHAQATFGPRAVH
jgi:hypothetical protein